MPFLAEDSDRQADLGTRLIAKLDLEGADFNQQAIVGLDAIDFASRGWRHIVVLETLQQFCLHQLGNAVAPLNIGKGRRIAARRRHQNALGVEHQDGGRIGQHKLALELPRRGGALPGQCQIINDLGRSRRTAASHPLETGNDIVELAGVARQPFGERLQIGERALQRLRVVGQNAVDTPQRIARRLRHALPRAGLRN